MYKKITVKIGSNVLATDQGGLNDERMAQLVDELTSLHHAGQKIILVSSGAVASGKGLVKTPPKMDPVSKRQLLSSVGQVKLINRYSQLFAKQNVAVAQVLVTKEDFRTREHYLNMKNCVTALWENNIIPIVNENDAVSVTALMFTDNDELSGLMASMMGCEALMILSNVDGIYNGDPKDKNSQVIKTVRNGQTDLSKYISTGKSDFGRGGMLTKCRIAQKTAASGIHVHIANGCKPMAITKLVQSPDTFSHTHFIADEPRPAIKKWIAYSEGFAKAEVTINKGAQEVLYSPTATSLLLAGVSWIQGEFKKGDLLRIRNEKGELIGIGKASYNKEMAEKHRFDTKYKPLVHYDYLFLFPQTS